MLKSYYRNASLIAEQEIANIVCLILPHVAATFQKYGPAF
jgi:hypothetical protein